MELAVEPVIFVADQHYDRTHRLPALLEGFRDARSVLVVLYQEVLQAERVQERLRVTRGRVGRDTATGPPSVPDHRDQREAGIEGHAP